tara:strand:- start:237 stop:377 length:141 start_codon:yes stop_codon:yes gene_type:complete
MATTTGTLKTVFNTIPAILTTWKLDAVTGSVTTTTAAVANIVERNA